MWKPKAKEEVVLKRTEKVGNVTLAITPCLFNPLTHCYCWTVLNERKNTDGTGRIQFGCAGCRKIRDAKSSKVAKDTPVPMWIAIRDEKIRWEGTGNGAAHFCNGPKERSELATGSVEKPCSAVAKLERKILDKAGNDQEKLNQMRIAASCEKMVALKKSFQRWMKKRFPPVKFLSDLKKDEFKNLQFTHRGAVAKEGDEHFEENFLLYSNKQLAIFATLEQLDLLRKSKTIVCDGTFRYRPQDTAQICRIFGFVAFSKKSRLSHCSALVTVLMRGKDRKLYSKVWEKVCEGMKPLGTVHIKHALFDCEKAAYKSFLDRFPGIVAKMCSFHAKQALIREVQSLGMMPTYRKEPEFAMIIRQIGALQLSPPKEWTKCLELIGRLIANTELTLMQKEKLCEVLDYYKLTWIALGAEFFSLFGYGGPRTTNSAESYHGRQQYFFRKRARIGEWIVRNRELHYQEQAQCAGIRSGRVIPNEPNPLYSEINAKLNNLQTNLTQFLDDEFTEQEYTEAMSKYLSQVGLLMGIKANPLSEKKGKNSFQDEDEYLQVEVPTLEPLVSDKDDEEKLKSFQEPNKEEAEDEPIVLDSAMKKPRLECEQKVPEKFLIIDGDGNCLYRSIAQHVYGSQHRHLEVRKNLMNKLVICRDEGWATSLFGTAEEIVQYVALHRKPGEWGWSKELAVAAKLYNRNFILYKPQWSTKFAYFSGDYDGVGTPLKAGVPSSVIRYSYGHFDVALE